MPKKYRKVKMLMADSDIDQYELARILERSPAYVSDRLRGKMPFSLWEVYTICDQLEIPYCEIPDFFPRDGIDAGKIRAVS